MEHQQDATKLPLFGHDPTGTNGERLGSQRMGIEIDHLEKENARP